MNVELNITGIEEGGYLNWVPVRCTIRLQDSVDPVNVQLKNIADPVGQLSFYLENTTDPLDELLLTLPSDGTPVAFAISGKFGFASNDDKDAGLDVVNSIDNQVLFTRRLMVRIRKNANNLSVGERDRLLRSFGIINTNGLFAEFRNMHLTVTTDEAHGNAGFLPWHRAYLLDLERELQSVDKSVSLPYWRFDQPTAQLFTQDFLGVGDITGNVRFSSSNPLRTWTTDGTVGVRRQPRFDPATSGANVIDEINTMRLGDDYENFVGMEGDPHGFAHTSFTGFVGSLNTAAKDPLFFLLHCNVDRLWAKWQWLKDRYDNSTTTYPFPGTAGDALSTRVGHNRLDDMWPWNGINTPPRPGNNPGGTFPLRDPYAPGSRPIVGDMIDYQGKLNPAANLGFDYDDVPFEI